MSQIRKKQKPDKLSIYHCFKWLYRLLFLTGCLSFYVKGNKIILNRFTKIYTNIIRIFLVVGFLGGFAMKLSDKESSSAMLGHLTPIIKFILTFEGAISTLTYVLVTITMEYHKHDHIKLLEQFNYLDKRMQKEFPYISWNYHKSVKKYTPFTVFIVCYYFIMAMTYLIKITHCTCGKTTTFMIATTYTLMTVSPGAVSFLQLGAMDMLRIRYRLIQRLIKQFRDSDKPMKKAQRLTVFYRRYTELILDINKVFSFVVGVGIFDDFGILTNLVYLICQKASESKAAPLEYIFIMFLMVPRVYKVIVTSIYGKLLDSAKQRCCHDLFTYLDRSGQLTPEMQQICDSFLYSNMLNNYDVNIGDTLRCNLNIIFVVFNGIANYVLILIQFQLQQNSITSRSRSMRKDVEILDKTKFRI